MALLCLDIVNVKYTFLYLRSIIFLLHRIHPLLICCDFVTQQFFFIYFISIPDSLLSSWIRFLVDEVYFTLIFSELRYYLFLDHQISEFFEIHYLFFRITTASLFTHFSPPNFFLPFPFFFTFRWILDNITIIYLLILAKFSTLISARDKFCH